MVVRSLVRVRSFVQVAQAGGVRVAAARLGYAPATVAAQVRQLEHQLRVQLLDRSQGPAVLTPAGRRLLPLMQETVTAATRLEREAALIAAGRAQGKR